MQCEGKGCNDHIVQKKQKVIKNQAFEEPDIESFQRAFGEPAFVEKNKIEQNRSVSVCVRECVKKITGFFFRNLS